MVLVITADHRDIISMQHGILLKTVVITLALTVILSGVVILLVRRIVRPLQALTEAAEKLAQNEYDVHFTPGNTTEIAQLTATFKHMREKLRDHNELQQILAYRDSLTGFKNATAFNTWRNDFERQWQETPPEFAVLVLDINNLKGTNDQYGHEAGNQLIVAASRIIADTFKRSPVFRIGGDEFLVILRNRDLQNHENLIREVSASCEEKFLIWGNQTIPVSIAIGIAEYDPRMDSSFTDVFNRADSAMYENKRKKGTHEHTCLIRFL